jgi:hypothetical protein
MKLSGISVGFNITDQLSITFFTFMRQWIKNWEYSETVRQLFMKAYDSVMKEVLDNILIDFWVPMRLVRLIKMCLNEMCSKVHIGKHCLIVFLSIDLKQGDALSPLLFN